MHLKRKPLKRGNRFHDIKCHLQQKEMVDVEDEREENKSRFN